MEDKHSPVSDRLWELLEVNKQIYHFLIVFLIADFVIMQKQEWLDGYMVWECRLT